MVATSFEPGTIINGRYAVRRVLGASDVSIVLEAEDLTLQRPVAVRVLVADVLASEEWREYIRHETTAVAALHHPNLTRIYEWGEQDGAIYIVSEYLPGGSLREVLAARGRLSQEQTAMIGLEVATALAYAHARGFVHGALRPSTILLDGDGRARVNDFGLVATLQTSQMSSQSLEMARYTSPEQVRGAQVEGRSDVYSLALILFECLTGHVPHDGRSLDAIRTNRLNTPLPHRPELGPFDLTLALGAAPEPAARPDAELFANRLSAVASSLPVPQPVTASAAGGGFVVPSPTDILTAPAVAATAVTTGRLPITVRENNVVRPFDLPGAREAFETARRPSAPPRNNGGRRALAVLVSMVLILLMVGLGVAWKAGAFTASFRVPLLVGQTEKQAVQHLGASKFVLTISGSSHSSSIPKSQILSQQPPAGTMLKQGSTIRVVVSVGPAAIRVPVVVLLGCQAAIAQLHAVGIASSCPQSLEQYNANAKSGAVIATYLGTIKNPSTVPQRSSLLLVVSKGPAPSSTTTTTTPISGTTTTTVPSSHAPVVVPNLVGKDRAQTLQLMQAAQLYYATYGPGSNNGTWTTVVSQSPAAGTTVPWHSSVKVTVK